MPKGEGEPRGDELDLLNQSLSQEAPSDQGEISEGSMEELVGDMEKIEQEIERELPPEKAKIIRSHWKGFVTALLMAASSAGAVETNSAYSQEGKNPEQTIEAKEKEKTPESKQLDVALLYLSTTALDLSRYNSLPVPKDWKKSVTRYANPLVRAFEDAYEKNLADKDAHKYRIAKADLQTAELTVMIELGKEKKGAGYEMGPADVNATESLDRVKDKVYEKLFGEKNKNPNQRLVLVASIDCKPPVDENKKRLGQWNEIPAIDVVLVSSRVVSLKKEDENLWNEFCGKNGSLTIITRNKDLNADDGHKDVDVRLYETLSEKLRPRDQQKSTKDKK